ncbi:hypothetical protein [Halalkalicoccus tibetensis]|uniref:DUF8139 domain-containing protein n=1 Tax=Halalkalicoccus tibetensis TaxID=175632 RepID=A0ABD5V360_9EURY
MGQLREGERIRIDIPDETDPDHHYHGEHGTVVEIISDEAGDPQDSRLYRVELESGEVLDFRGRDLRPPFE